MATIARRPSRPSVPYPLLATLVAVFGCAPALAPWRQEPMAPVPTGIQEVHVVPPSNHTGTPLVVNDPGLLTSYFESKTSVPELLAADLRDALKQRGYRVERVGTEAPRLQVDIRRWEPYSPDYSRVTVDLVASLEGSTGRLWRVERTNWRVATQGAGSSIEASDMATEAIAEALLEGWQAAGSAAK